ncbi:MAG: lipid A biosynthesis acyltransferase, partial [Chromatiaceae bacterium]
MPGQDTRRSPDSGLWHPRHWPSWLAVALVYGLGRLPFPLIWALGRGLGRLAYSLAGDRRTVASRNLELCLPEAPKAERERILRDHFGWLGVAALSQGVGWGISR